MTVVSNKAKMVYQKETFSETEANVFYRKNPIKSIE